MTNDQQGSDLGVIFDTHVQAEFEQQDVDATMATMVDDPYVNHVPTMTGGTGRQGVHDFYANHFIGKWPDDTKLVPISRTVGTSRIVDEFVVTFTHNTELDAYLPGVAPTGHRVELPHIVVMGVRDGKVTHEHIYWDQGSLLVQVGLLDPSGLPVVGVEQARKLLDRSLPSNELIIRHVTRM